MSDHTPEPWRLYPPGACVPHYDVRERIVSDCPSGRSVSDPISEADARRIVACVNACAGIPTEALEAGAVREALDLLVRLLGSDVSRNEVRAALAKVRP